VDWPASFGDWLWTTLVVWPADFLNRLTLRHVAKFLLLTILVIALAHTFPLDLAYIFAGDVLTYLEVFTVVSLLAARGRVGAVFYVVRSLVVGALREIAKATSYLTNRGHHSHRRRVNNIICRRRRLNASDKLDNDPAPVIWAFQPA
jgi:hypothetical protein